MRKIKLLYILILTITTQNMGYAQKTQASAKISDKKKSYLAGAMDGAFFSVASIQSPYNVNSVVRFSANIGVNYNYDVSKHFGIFTGLGIKNLGFIDRGPLTMGTGVAADITVKRRVYSVGLPLGVKIGSVSNKGIFGMLGGGVDFPINYKEKTFINGKKNSAKFSEWFSNATPRLLPYVFAGISVRDHYSVKVLYYPGNFLNPNYSRNNGTTKPYAGYETHIALLSLCYYLERKG